MCVHFELKQATELLEILRSKLTFVGMCVHVLKSRQQTISPTIPPNERKQKDNLEKTIFFLLFNSSPFINTLHMVSSPLSVSFRLLCDGVIIEDKAAVFNTG